MNPDTMQPAQPRHFAATIYIWICILLYLVTTCILTSYYAVDAFKTLSFLSLQLIILGTFALACLLASMLATRYIERVYQTHWHDRSTTEPNADVDWPQVQELMTDDPITFKQAPRLPLFRFLRDLLIVTALYVIFLGALGLTLKFLDHPSLGRLTQLKDLSIVVGALTLIATVFGLFYNARLKARTENRHKWIELVRQDINSAIANFPEPHFNQLQIKEARKRYTEFHTRLELYLNPSEKTHRALLAIIRDFYHVKIAIDDEVKKHITLGEWKEDKDLDGWINQKSCAIRLANAVLKREWEQVKHLR